MTASGVCHSDLHVRDGEWPRPGPFVIGHEGAGVVTALGPDVDPAATGLRPGVAVALSWIAPCGRCRHCLAGRAWLCVDNGAVRHRMADGTTRLHAADGRELLAYCGLGTMAEEAIVAASAAVPLPDGVDPAVAALIGCCVSTGVGAVLKTAAVAAGSSAVVIGLGGVGLSVVMGLVLAGADPIVAVDRDAGQARPGPRARRDPRHRGRPGRRMPRGRDPRRRPAAARTTRSRRSACARRSSSRSAACRRAGRPRSSA